MKYDVSKDFGIFRNFHSTLNPLVLRLAKFCLTICPKGMKSSKDLVIEKTKILVRDGSSIKTYIIKPRDNAEAMPVIFYFHGGAFAYKAAPYHYKQAKEYARQTGAMVIFVDYRLSYCSPFDYPLNDCFDVYKHFVENSKKYNIDKTKICVAGDSAGGYLSLMTILRAKRENIVLPSSQMLIYPVVDSRCDTKSMTEFYDTPFWNSKLNRKMWQIYQKGGVAQNILDEEDLSFIPATYIETAEFDCLKDEGINLFERLNAYNKENIINNTKKTMHGYDIFAKSEITKASLKQRIDFLNKHLK